MSNIVLIMLTCTRLIYFNIRDNYFKLYVHLDRLHLDIIIFHVDTLHLACRDKSMQPKQFRYLNDILDISFFFRNS